MRLSRAQIRGIKTRDHHVIPPNHQILPPHLGSENKVHATPYFREVILGKLPKITSRYYRATQA